MRSPRSAPGTAALAAVALIIGLWVIRVGIHLPEGNAGTTSEIFADSSRALGIAAIILAGAALPVGLIVGRRLVPRHAGDARAVHRVLALWALVATALHMVTLLGATELGPSVLRLIVPFAWPHKTIVTGLGVLATWVIAVLGLSFYQRHRIGQRRWRIAHRFIITGLALATIHVIGGG